jgi:hypothetical protein
LTDRTTPDELLSRARRLVEDLNMSTLGWQIPSDRLIDDFAAGEHRLLAREHELIDRDPTGSRGASRRAFTLYPLGSSAEAQPFSLLIEPSAHGRWELFAADARGG